MEDEVVEKKASEDFERILQQMVKINQEVEDNRLKKILSVSEKMDNELLKVCIAVLIDISKIKYESFIFEIALLHEKDVQKDERKMFANILVYEVIANKQNILLGLDRLILSKREIKIEKKSQTIDDDKTSHDLEFEYDYDEYCHRNKTKKIKKPVSNKQVFVVYKNNKTKNFFTSRQKILSVLEKNQSFLVYKDPFDLPKGIKRIRIKESFQDVVLMIESYIKESHLSAKIIIEQNRAKILFKGYKEIKQHRDKKNVRLKVA